MSAHSQGNEGVNRLVGLVAEPAEVDVVYLTPAQVAAMLQVNIKSLYRWATEDPSMPCLRIGTKVRFPKERLLAWLRSREQGRPRTRHQVLASAKPAPPQEARGA